MKRVYLSEGEKAVIRFLAVNGDKPGLPSMYIARSYIALEGFASLVDRGFASGEIVTDGHGDMISGRLTLRGRVYYEEHPRLYNPIPWERILLAITAAASLLALFLGCVTYSKL